MSWITSLNFSSLDCEMGSRAGLSLMAFAKTLWSKYPYLNLSQSCLKSLMKWPGLKILKQETLRCWYKFQLPPKCWQMLLTLPLGSSPASYLEPQSPLEDRNLSVESREWAGTRRERWGVLSQGERVCRPGPIPGLGIKENSYPFFVIRVKNVLCPGTHYFLPIFLCLTLLAWQRGPWWIWCLLKRQPWVSLIQTWRQNLPRGQLAPSAIVSFLPVQLWEVTYLRKERYSWPFGSRYFHPLTPFHNYIPFRASVGISLKSISKSRFSI